MSLFFSGLSRVTIMEDESLTYSASKIGRFDISPRQTSLLSFMASFTCFGLLSTTMYDAPSLSRCSATNFPTTPYPQTITWSFFVLSPVISAISSFLPLRYSTSGLIRVIKNGVTTIESITTRTRSCTNSESKSPPIEAKAKITKENSPTCESASAVLSDLLCGEQIRSKR